MQPTCCRSRTLNTGYCDGALRSLPSEERKDSRRSSLGRSHSLPLPLPSPSGYAEVVTERAYQTAALYHRVSTHDQDERGALLALRRAAEEDGWGRCDEFAETGSGALNDRPELVRLMGLVRQRRIRAVYVWKLDRFGRSALDLLRTLDELERRGVQFTAVSQGIDVGPGGTDSIGKLMLTMLSAIAEFERELIRDRTRQGLARARERGTKLGRPPSRILPDGAEIAVKRAQKVSWRQISAEVGRSVFLCRKALRQWQENGSESDPQKARRFGA